MALKKLNSSTNENLAVVAIDFGTTFTGFAFSFRHDKHKIYTSSYRGKFEKDKVPTTVLFNPDKSFNSFGFEAEEEYAKLADKEEHSKYFYFKWFKMALYLTKKLTRDITINDCEGGPMCAMYVFQTAIENLRNNARSAIIESFLDNIRDEDIQWILTIPAIWSDSARQFMREAAVLAGIAENQLKLVLEPEAASLYCKEQPFRIITNPDQSVEVGKFEEGHKYILADLGGGTADICVHQIVADGNIRELYRATGDALGATCVNMAFQQFFIELIAAKSWMEFKYEYMDEYIEFMKSFESKKNAFSSQKKEEKLTIPAGLLSVVKKNLGERFDGIIPETKYANSISVHKRNKLLISYEVMEGFFKITVEGIVTLLKEILDEMETENIQTLLLVGGFSDSKYLVEIIQSEIKGVRVIFPPDGSLAVLKGAVMMGNRPRTIVERKARFSYGSSISRLFQEGVDPERLRWVHDGEVYCDRVFIKLITKGEILTCGQVIKWSSYGTYKTQESKHRTFYTTLYKSTESDPSYCTEEEGCTEIGRIERKPPQGGWPDKIDIENHLIVGEVEFTFKVFDKTTGAQYEAKMEFL